MCIYSELLQEITKETSRYIRHSLRSGATPLSTKDEQIPQKIDQSYAEVDKLADEKIQLSERLGTLIQRARTRLDYDLRRVLILQGDDPGQPAFVSTSRNPVQEMNDSLRLAIAESSPIIPQQPVVLSTTQAPTQKSTFCPPFLTSYRRGLKVPLPYVERKVVGIAAASSIKQPSPVPTSTPVLPQRTRLAQQQSHRPPPARARQIQQEIPGPDEDAEGEDDVEEGNGDEDEDNEDKTLYCFCQKMSYGEVCVTSVLTFFLIITDFYQMVACDNAECRYQWVGSCRINVSILFRADFVFPSFICPASASNRHCRRCGTVLIVFRRVPLVVWIVQGQSARRSARGRKDTMRHVLYCYYYYHETDYRLFSYISAYSQSELSAWFRAGESCKGYSLGETSLLHF